ELAWRDPTATLRSFETKEYAAERDFLVYPHWGKVPMLVKDEHGVRRRVDGEQSPWASMQFSDAFRPKLPSKARIFYRLENLGDPVHPDTPDKRIQLLPAHVMTPRHYELARDLFRFVYEFFAQEYSHRDRFLGKLLELQKSGGSQPTIQAQRELAKADDLGGTPTAIGEVGGFVLHPDVPSAGTRRHHQNHIHANLGHGAWMAHGALSRGSDHLGSVAACEVGPEAREPVALVEGSGREHAAQSAFAPVDR